MKIVRTEKVVPFLKWAGGKRWFADRHTHLLPDSYERYFEPFLGGGALYFAEAPERAVLSDLNADLIATYQVARDFPTDLTERLQYYHERHSRDTYYAVRGTKPSDKIELAAWFLYLNRTCWNGLYRVNLQNVFNVPIGTKTDVVLPTDNFMLVSELLAQAEIQCCDFESTINAAKEGDFVFVDPPYTVKHNENGFVKYNDRIFSWSDQIRLRDAVLRASRRGAKVLVTNANHASIRELYQGIGSQMPVTRASVLAGKSAYRASVEELAIRTWIAD
ncbi:DNA adenine methylase [Mesorhizobium marinum]|uniref:DNA adenine methylase n=1 Tax=Mesorhizobium marinum TaxID=3228790 RepID=UPI003466B2BB